MTFKSRFHIVYRWNCGNCFDGHGEYHDLPRNSGDTCEYCDTEYSRDQIVNDLSYSQIYVETDPPSKKKRRKKNK